MEYTEYCGEYGSDPPGPLPRVLLWSGENRGEHARMAPLHSKGWPRKVRSAEDLLVYKKVQIQQEGLEERNSHNCTWDCFLLKLFLPSKLFFIFCHKRKKNCFTI